MRKIKTFVAIILSVLTLSLAGPLTGLTPAAQAGSCNDEDANFLSFPTWYRGLCGSDGKVNLEGQEPGLVVIKIGLNVVDMALRLIALAAIAFIIWGGFQYVMARGEPGNIAKAKLTITYAIAGLIVGIASSAIVGFIAGRIE